MDVNLNGHPQQVLWDTGAQVSMVSREWHNKWLSELPVKNIQELVPTKLDLLAANGTPILFDGWVEVEVEITLKKPNARRLMVPMLVTPEALPEPILGHRSS